MILGKVQCFFLSTGDDKGHHAVQVGISGFAYETTMCGQAYDSFMRRSQRDDTPWPCRDCLRLIFEKA